MSASMGGDKYKRLSEISCSIEAGSDSVVEWVPRTAIGRRVANGVAHC